VLFQFPNWNFLRNSFSPWLVILRVPGKDLIFLPTTSSENSFFFYGGATSGQKELNISPGQIKSQCQGLKPICKFIWILGISP
jgi:hypothetical protein